MTRADKTADVSENATRKRHRIRHDVEIAIIGAGIAGIATAYYACQQSPKSAPLLIDFQQPLSFTSAQSGENYRNWWPHPTMTAFTDHSIDLMEQIDRDSGNVLQMTRRGYALASRKSNIDALIDQLYIGYGQAAEASVRTHNTASGMAYETEPIAGWETAPDGVDILQDQGLIHAAFPSFGDDIAHVVHIRRAGDISSQQMGQYMLGQIRSSGGRLLNGKARTIRTDGEGFELEAMGPDTLHLIRARKLCIAVGPFIGELANMLGQSLPITNVFQQKIAFRDHRNAIPRHMPFAIDLDAQKLDWSEDESNLLGQDPHMAHLIKTMPGGIHCRPDGGENGEWIRLGWAYSTSESPPSLAPETDPHFPEIVLRGAARLNPSLKAYYGHLPRNWVHYGGYYTLTSENWPLIGPLEGVEHAYIVGALSGFGSMSACAAGELCASWMLGKSLPDYAQDLSLSRYKNEALMKNLHMQTDRGIL